MKHLIRKQLPDWFDGEVYDEGDEVRDPFTGTTFVLDAAELSMYDLIKGAEMVLNMGIAADKDNLIDIIRKGEAWFKAKNLDAHNKLLSNGAPRPPNEAIRL
jgi:hypothetical protein